MSGRVDKDDRTPVRRRYDATLPDRTAVRRVMAVKPIDQPVEYLRVTMDLGAPVVLHAFAWALAAPDLYPTMTVHGSNNPEFMLDSTATVTRDSVGAVYCGNRHTLSHDADLLWEMRWQDPGSTWTPAEVAAGLSEIIYTRLSSSPRYSRLYVDGTMETLDYQGFTGHSVPLVDNTPPSYQYYALTISVGRVAAVTGRYVLELQQWQPVIEAPPPSALPDAGTAVLYGQVPLKAATSATDDALLDVVVTKDLPSDVDLYGYVEVWATFRNRGYYHQGKEWTTASFPTEIHFQANNTRRALVTLPEILVPRRVLIRTRNCTITTVPARAPPWLPSGRGATGTCGATCDSGRCDPWANRPSSSTG